MIEQFIYISAAYTVKNWGFLSWVIIITALLGLGSGVLLFIMERNGKNDVIPLTADVPE